MRFRKLTLMSIICVAMSACAATAHAEDVKVGDLVISQAWSRATPNGARTGGGYLTIENKGSAPDRLIDGVAAVAGQGPGARSGLAGCRRGWRARTR